MPKTREEVALALVEIAEPQAQPLAVVPNNAPAVATPGDLLRIAMATANPDLDRLERLMEMQERHERREAEKAYADAMAMFKANPPTIGKNKKADFPTAKGRTTYDFSDLGNVVAQIVPALAAHGFAHRWSLAQSGKSVTVTCTITHRLGHSESVTMTADNDETGGKNSIQSIGSAKSYLERYTLLAATGLAVSDGSDDDGATSGVRAEAAPEKQEKHKIVGPRFDEALLSIRQGIYSPQQMRAYYELEPDQEKKLAALVAELGL